MKITKVSAREVLDSRGNPTIAATCELSDGSLSEASVPSGASTGKEEAKELRDGDKKYFNGLGVKKAVKNVNKIIAPKIVGLDARNQKKLDQFLCEIDGTPDKSRLGANAILAVSVSAAKAQAISDHLDLYQYLAVKYWGIFKKRYALPTPMFNIINGGKHARNNIDIQETMIVPTAFKSFAKKMQAGSEIYHTLKKILELDGYFVGLGDEGGFAPNFADDEKVFFYIRKAIRESGYRTTNVRISLDIAADSLYSSKTKTYNFVGEKKDFDSERMIKRFKRWAQTYSLLSIEDGLYEKDPLWPKLTAEIKPTISVGDDLLVTNYEKIKEAAKTKKANGVIIKPNQTGTLTETFKAIREAQKAKMKVIVSHRSGETEDSFIADLAVAVGADFIKSGAPARSERLAKYNRLLKIERDLIRKD